MLYQPLTLTQEEKYREFMQRKEGAVKVHTTDKLESGEVVQETMQIPRITANTGRFNTQNLQAEIAKSMQQIMDANTKGTVSDTMDNLKKIVEDIPYLQVPAEDSGRAVEDERYGGVLGGGYNAYFPEFYPDGDYYFFVQRDLKWGYLGHPWRREIWLFGAPLVERLSLGLEELGFPVKNKSKEE